MAVGNRDLDTKNIKATANQFLSYFGPSRYSTRNWWGGTGPNSVNTYQIFNVGGKKFLHVSLEWRPRDTVITWARKILTANPELPTILTTHQYLGFGPQGFDNVGTTPDSIGDNGGLDLRHKLVEPFPQVFFANCGHNTGGNHRSTNTILGQRVHEIMADYSLDPDGGNGWMNLLEYQPDKGRIINSCFSSTYKPGITTGPDRSIDPKNNATFDYAFHTHRRTLEETRALRFTGRHDNGHGAYSGALDTFVWSKSATTSHGSFTDIQVEDESSSDKHQGLIKFGGIFGTSAGQIPTNRRIVRAILTLTTEGTFATSVNVSRLYQLKVPFDESSTWKSLNNGIQIGTETVATAVVSTGNLVSTKGTRSFDVTATLRAWQAGDKNHGWAIVNDGADTWTFRSQEWSAPAERPMLTVIYER
jgi:hypothetical protein